MKRKGDSKKIKTSTNIRSHCVRNTRLQLISLWCFHLFTKSSCQETQVELPSLTWTMYWRCNRDSREETLQSAYHQSSSWQHSFTWTVAPQPKEQAESYAFSLPQSPSSHSRGELHVCCYYPHQAQPRKPCDPLERNWKRPGHACRQRDNKLIKCPMQTMRRQERA